MRTDLGGGGGGGGLFRPLHLILRESADFSRDQAKCLLSPPLCSPGSEEEDTGRRRSRALFRPSRSNERPQIITSRCNFTF